MFPPHHQLWFRGVRPSKFRHVYGLPSRKESCYTDISAVRSGNDGNFCAVNQKLIAIVADTMFVVFPVGQVLYLWRLLSMKKNINISPNIRRPDALTFNVAKWSVIRAKFSIWNGIHSMTTWLRPLRMIARFAFGMCPAMGWHRIWTKVWWSCRDMCVKFYCWNGTRRPTMCCSVPDSIIWFVGNC